MQGGLQSAESRRWASTEVRSVDRNPNLQRLGKGPVRSEGKGREDSEAGILEDGGKSRPRDRMGSERRDRVVRSLQMGGVGGVLGGQGEGLRGRGWGGPERS